MSDKKRVATILNISLQISANLSVLAEPFLPFSAKKLAQMLNISNLNWRDAGRTDILKAGQTLGEAKLLFEKVEDDVIEKQILKLQGTKDEGRGTTVSASAPRPPSPDTNNMATIDDFKKLDIRVGKIVEVQDFPEAKKPAYKLKIDFGKEIGIKNSSAQLTKNYTKEQLKDKLVLGVVNFPPRKVGPFISEVLTLGVPDKNNDILLVDPGKDAVIGGKLS